MADEAQRETTGAPALAADAPHGAYVRLARELRRRGQQTTAIIAAGPEVDGPRVILSLAIAMARVSGAKIACVAEDWPLLAAARRSLPDLSAGASYETYRLSPAVVLMCPRPPVMAGNAPLRLAAIATVAAPHFEHVVVDLSSLEGAELGVAVEIADGVVALARAGKTPARALVRIRRELPPSAAFGVALVEG